MADDILDPAFQHGTKEYHRRKSSEWYQRTKTSSPEKLTARQRYVADRRRAAKADWVTRLGGACAHCGGRFADCVFEFHHLSSEEKEYSPSHLFHLAPDTIEAELKKCVMLCANCHRIEHERLKYADHAKRKLLASDRAKSPAAAGSGRKGPGVRLRCQYRLGDRVFKTQAEAARALGVSAATISLRVSDKGSGWLREMVYDL